MSTVIICRPSDEFLRKRYLHCVMCQVTTEAVLRFEAWYGVTHYCCRCGDAWTDGELHERPFARGWRDRAVRKHRKLWDQATHGPGPTFAQLMGEVS
jgi:hypothetical protein